MNNIVKDRHFGYYHQKFAVVANNNYFRPGRDVWVKQLREFGFDAEAFESFEDFRTYDPTCVIVLGITNHPKPNDRSKIWVAIQTEQFYHRSTGGIHQTTQWLKKSLPYLKRYDIIMDFSKTNAESIAASCRSLRKKNILVHPFCCLGEFPISNAAVEKEYDLLFVGWHSRMQNCTYSRRDLILQELAKTYKIYPLSNELWGEEKLNAIKKSKICLNLHSEESRVMETARLLDYFSNHAFVLSDRIFDSSPFIDGEDYASFFLTDLSQKIDYYLSHEDEREKIAESAYQKVAQIDFGKAAAMLVDAVLLEADRKGYKKEMRRYNRRRFRSWIYHHLPEKIRDKIM